MTNAALVVIDLQNDFCPGGALALSQGDKIVPVVNRLMDTFKEANLPIFATRDWHPSDHCSFQQQGGLWPPHCVQNRHGAEFHPGLKLPHEATVISKGCSAGKDAYSGFDGTELAHCLKEDGVDTIVVCGLATDYCVKATALDGLREGFNVTVAEDAIRGVNVKPDDSEKALAEVKEAGAKATSHQEIRLKIKRRIS